MMKKPWIQPEEYIKSLSRKRMSAGAIFLDNEKSILLVKPNYKDEWTIPGGVVDANESPLQACVREVQEEIGLGIETPRFLGVAYKMEKAENDESVHFYFFAGRLSSQQIASIHLDPEELDEFRFVDVESAGEMVSSRLKQRIPKIIEAIQNNQAFYMESWV